MVAYENTVFSSWRTTTLGVAQSRHTRVEAQALDQDVLDILGLDGIKILVERTLGDDDNALALSDLAVMLEDVAHGRLPVVLVRGVLGDEDKVCSCRDSSHERQPAAVTSHYFNDERARV